MNYSNDEWNLPEDIDVSGWPAPMHTLSFHKTKRGLFLTLESAGYNGIRFYSTSMADETKQPWWNIWDGSFPDDIIVPCFLTEDFSEEEIEIAESFLFNP